MTKEILIQQITAQTAKDPNQDHLLERAESIIDNLSTSIHWKNGKSIPEIIWNHRSKENKEYDWQNLSFKETELETVITDYLKFPQIHCQELDWLIMDILIYKDCLNALDTIRVRTMPHSRYQSKKSGNSTFRILAELWRFGLFILKILAWIIIFSFTTIPPYSLNTIFLHLPITPILWIVITLGWLGKKWIDYRKNNNYLKVLFNTYDILKNSLFSWSEIQELLKRSQKFGMMWNNLIYQLVKARV
ncbi:hypothetical protein [Candidatus Nitrosacidococcus tergens]|uniref:Uncharacterized protein n=1 Tax=Candidatus Nitrosacidococcus tergens TaxID=553981 RepID=A0A7G1Q775_9GAMM|nr:hypothetical protein [Candidatus Nitrosacidococcus tergens]CAB1274194.1 conserved protein of unknown function [Candidatus Nitrosacidococcus tergens]